jgi:hypothetical protein
VYVKENREAEKERERLNCVATAVRTRVYCYWVSFLDDDEIM